MARGTPLDPKKTIEQLRDELDPETAAITAVVQHAVVTGPDRPAVPKLPPTMRAVTGEALTARLTQITADTPDGLRCWLVKVQETTPPLREES